MRRLKRWRAFFGQALIFTIGIVGPENNSDGPPIEIWIQSMIFDSGFDRGDSKSKLVEIYFFVGRRTRSLDYRRTPRSRSANRQASICISFYARIRAGRLRIGAIEGLGDIDYETGPKTSSSVLLTRDDWRFVLCLNHNARRENIEVARELSVSPKTVQRRLRFLQKTGAIRFGLQIDISNAKDLFPYLLLVQLQPRVSKSRTYDRVKQVVSRIWRNMTTVNPFLLTLASHAVKLSDLEKDTEQLRMTQGVRGVSVLFNSSDLSNDSWLDERILRAAGLTS